MHIADFERTHQSAAPVLKLKLQIFAAQQRKTIEPSTVMVPDAAGGVKLPVWELLPDSQQCWQTHDPKRLGSDGKLRDPPTYS